MARVHDLLERVSRQHTAALMGVINATPNSFFDGGRYNSPAAVRERVLRVIAEGADILDIGGESSKPGAPAISAAEQIDRIAPALAEASERRAIISVDTASPEVADYALGHGAELINDVTCLQCPELASVVARHEAQLILSHSRAHQSQMLGFSVWDDDAYSDVVAEVGAELNAARQRAVDLGVAPKDLLYDPGLGFSKNARHCFELLTRLNELVGTGVPLVVGTGRKSFIAALDGSAADERLGGTIAASLAATRAGARVLRVHDVAPLRQALEVERAIARGLPAQPKATA